MSNGISQTSTSVITQIKRKFLERVLKYTTFKFIKFKPSRDIHLNSSKNVKECSCEWLILIIPTE